MIVTSTTRNVLCSSTGGCRAQTQNQPGREANLATPPINHRQPVSRRTALAAALWTITAMTLKPQPAAAEVETAAEAAAAASTSAAAEEGVVMPVYFGNGCFWGRQKDFVDAELSMGRLPESISAVVGYAGGGHGAGPGSKVCYYYGPEGTLYEKLGHAEVVQLQVSARDVADAKRQMKTLADVYFSQFRKTPFGMSRQDPQDMGPGYRNVIGIPGGMDSPMMDIIKAANVHGMQLARGSGNTFEGGRPSEGDAFNTVWVLDSAAHPFYPAERYHQFHNGLGKAFPTAYTQGLKQVALDRGLIGDTGCPESSLF